jgi:Carbohydrate-selective porin, OprB family/S-layer homology domain
VKSATPCIVESIAPSIYWMFLLISIVGVTLGVLPARCQSENPVVPFLSLQDLAFASKSAKFLKTAKSNARNKASWSELIAAPGNSINELAATQPEIILVTEVTPKRADENASLTVSAPPLPTTAIDVNLPSGNNEASASVAQVTSVSQLSDVQPTDWAFQALQSLVERYDCLAGYSNGTFRGDRPLTRYEFAAGLNGCVESLNKLIASTSKNTVAEADLIALQRLQTEFATELTTLVGRVDALEAQTAELESQQFSTTTKLSGLVWFNVNGAFYSGNVKRETGDRVALGSRERVVENAKKPNVTTSGLVWLDFTTSFTGRDKLLLEMAAGNGIPLANQLTSAGFEYSFGADFTNQSGGINSNQFTVRQLLYQFPIGDRLQLVISPRVNFFDYFDNNAFTYFFTGKNFIFNFLTFNSANSTLVNAIDRGTGAIALWQINQQLELRTAYLGENDEYLPSPPFNSASNPSQGLFGGTNTTTAELTYKPNDKTHIRLLYNRTNIQQIGGKIGSGGTAEPIYGIADDGFGGPLDNATADTFTLNFDWLVTSKFGVFGRYSYGSTNLSPTTPGRPDGEVNVQAFQLGLAFPDLVKAGTLGTLSFVVPYDILKGREFLASGGGNGGTELDIEASYYLPLTDNISVLPSLLVIVNPNNFSDNPSIFVANIRTQFSF